MPTAPKQPCRTPRCPALVERGQGWCPTHRRERARRYNQTQRPAGHAFYKTPAWQALRRRVLQERGVACVDCGRITPHPHVDHILTVRERPDLALDASNVAIRCLPCHSRKTAREDGRWGPRRG